MQVCENAPSISNKIIIEKELSDALDSVPSSDPVVFNTDASSLKKPIQETEISDNTQEQDDSNLNQSSNASAVEVPITQSQPASEAIQFSIYQKPPKILFANYYEKEVTREDIVEQMQRQHNFEPANILNQEVEIPETAENNVLDHPNIDPEAIPTYELPTQKPVIEHEIQQKIEEKSHKSEQNSEEKEEIFAKNDEDLQKIEGKEAYLDQNNYKIDEKSAILEEKEQYLDQNKEDNDQGFAKFDEKSQESEQK